LSAILLGVHSLRIAWELFTMSKSPFLVGAAIAAVLLLLTGVSYGFWRSAGATAAALDDHGVVTIATVERMRTDTHRVRTNNGSRTETDYLVTYSFEAQTPAGETIPQRIEHEVPRGVFNELRDGQEVEIRYLPEDPSRADFYPGETQGAARVLGWAMAVMLGIAAAVLSLGVLFGRTAQRAPIARGPIQSA
jgi:hypothetical protein